MFLDFVCQRQIHPVFKRSHAKARSREGTSNNSFGFFAPPRLRVKKNGSPCFLISCANARFRLIARVEWRCGFEGRGLTRRREGTSNNSFGFFAPPRLRVKKTFRKSEDAKAQGRKERPQDKGIALPTFASLRLGVFALNSSSSSPFFRPQGGVPGASSSRCLDRNTGACTDPGFSTR